jgi:hypothetical protein
MDLRHSLHELRNAAVALRNNAVNRHRRNDFPPQGRINGDISDHAHVLVRLLYG